MSEIQNAAELIFNSVHAIALTGAGISTDSGIPDFRSPDGLFAKYGYDITDIEAFRKSPYDFFKLASRLISKLENAKPNAGHKALVELEKMGKLEAVITQNIDNLHQKAGNKRVLELHGTYLSASCMNCRRKYSFEDVKELMKGFLPLCQSCFGIVKPDVTFFGETLPPHVFEEAAGLAGSSDLIIVAGSSLEVFPASELPSMTKRNGGKIILVNATPTVLDEESDIVCRGNTSEVLKRIVTLARER
jgi:NAD-dependent deacetylase